NYDHAAILDTIEHWFLFRLSRKARRAPLPWRFQTDSERPANLSGYHTVHPQPGRLRSRQDERAWISQPPGYGRDAAVPWPFRLVRMAVSTSPPESRDGFGIELRRLKKAGATRSDPIDRAIGPGTSDASRIPAATGAPILTGLSFLHRYTRAPCGF